MLILLLFAGIVYSQVDENKVDWGVHGADYSSVGTVGWQFLKLTTNARNAALGGIRSPIGSGDANASLSNPASAADVQGLGVAFNHMKWVADIGYHSFSLLKNLGDLGVIGLHSIYVDYGEEIRTEYIEQRLVSTIVYSPVFDCLGTFGASDFALGVTYAQQVTDKLQVGANLRYLQERIDDASTVTWAFDIGTVFYTGFKSLRIAMLGRNFGPDAEFRQFSDRIEKVPFRIKLPMMLSIGVAMDVIEQGSNDGHHHLTVAFEYNTPNDGSKKVQLGSEYTFMGMLVFRAGYRFNYDEEHFTFGGGLRYKQDSFNICIDYAYMDVGLFNQVHMFSVGIDI